MMQAKRRDLVILVADKDMEETMRGLLGRPDSLRVRPIDAAIYRHPGRDGGCRTNGVTFLRAFSRQFHHALLMFDLEGSGRDASDVRVLEREVEEDLSRNGWQDRAAAIILDPELEIWVWSESPQVDRVCGWAGRIPQLREWLKEEGFLQEGGTKPQRPKEAFRHALRHVRKQPSAALFREMASKVGLRTCKDRAFQRLTQTLRKWFPRFESADTQERNNS